MSPFDGTSVAKGGVGSPHSGDSPPTCSKELGDVLGSTVRTGWLLGACLVLAPSAARAQANLTVTATVFQTLAVVGQRNLRFDNVFPGVPKTVAPDNIRAGRWRIRGQRNAPIVMTFTLPPNLVRNGTGELMPVGSWAATWDINNTPAGATAFTPSAAPTPAQLSNNGQAQVFVYIGATVTPAPNQRAGAYQATATLTVAYQ